ncbi:hypothetical protein HYPSUDRAFT_145449 [Hypholoma sublateritium FD-334 SS-4]|uniref:Uncharacterized protein n=1 Tax=Hypholoma sublateritium (strain FD-334 SS-4) TaxID=945553 RepID=A0A0D2PCX9_HYPSF|nr:hypothetical protein HYPSUDRAFT_145449 [Hypholoma sublateritium FD-334 SS-4]
MKTYPDHRKKSNRKLRSIAKEVGEDGETNEARGAIGRMGGRDTKKVEQDYELLLSNLEEDLELRSGFNLYKASEVTMATRGRKGHLAMDVIVPEAVQVEDDEDKADFPDIQLDVLLEGFNEMSLGAGNDAEHDESEHEQS